MKHARLSPSASKRWLTCPGSIQLCEKLGVVSKPNIHTATGTVAHDIGEQCLRDSTLNPEQFLGSHITSDDFDIKVTDDMIQAVNIYVNYVRGLISDYRYSKNHYSIYIEEYSSLSFLHVPGLDGGTADCVLVNLSKNEVHIIDYKHGKGVAVDPENNTQAMCYALGVVQKLNLNEFDVHVTIVQPRCKEGESIKTWITTSEHLKNWARHDLKPKAMATLQPDAKLVPSVEGCRFCPASGNCSALFNESEQAAMVEFKDVAALPDVRTLTVEQKQLIMDNASLLRNFIASVESQVSEEIKAGSTQYPEFKLVRKKTNRRFTANVDDPICSPLFEHLDHHEIYDEKIKSMTKIESLLKKKLGKTDSAEFMKTITTKPEGEIIVAPISDNRKSVEIDAVNDFTSLMNETKED